MQRYVIANWKMNPGKPSEAKKLFAGIKLGVTKERRVEVVVCPPHPFLGELTKELRGSKVKLGVQDLSFKDTGAYTGEVSAPMVQAYKATYVLIGHSERRELGEGNDLVARKVEYAIASGLRVVLCVGERERRDDGAYFAFIAEELTTALAGMKRKDLERLMIAYEPVWAIGKTAQDAMTTEALYEMVLFIRKVLSELFGRAYVARVPILYGGSAKAENAAELVTEGGTDGLLVGSASLVSKEFTKIVAAVGAVR